MKEKQNKTKNRKKVNTGSRKTKVSKMYSLLKFQHGSVRSPNSPTDSNSKLGTKDQKTTT